MLISQPVIDVKPTENRQLHTYDFIYRINKLSLVVKVQNITVNYRDDS